MPEGPEVKVVATTLAERLVHRRFGDLWHSPFSLRKKPRYDQLQQLSGQRIDEICTHGKMIFFSCEGKTALLAQLGMTGQLTVQNVDAVLLPHTHLRWPLHGTNLEMRYVDPRRFGMIDSCSDDEKKKYLSVLGPDPFTMHDEHMISIVATIKKSSRSIKEILLDQSVIAGVGNIYASEALFLAKIHPELKGSSAHDDQLMNLIVIIGKVLWLAYHNSGTSFSNYVDGHGARGKNLSYLHVFKREGLSCRTCGSMIVRIKQQGRSTFFCQTCQPLITTTNQTSQTNT